MKYIKYKVYKVIHNEKKVKNSKPFTNFNLYELYKLKNYLRMSSFLRMALYLVMSVLLRYSSSLLRLPTRFTSARFVFTSFGLACSCLVRWFTRVVNTAIW